MQKRNLLLITIDCLRPDHLGCYGYENNTISPNIDSLATSGVVVTNAISVAPYTTASVPSILSSDYPGKYPGELESLNQRNVPQFISDQRTMLAEILSDNGYYTAAFIDSNAYLSSYYHYNRGFSDFNDFVKKNTIERTRQRSFKSLLHNVFRPMFRLLNYVIRRVFAIQPILGAKRITKYVNNQLKNSSSPFFLWVHFMDVHSWAHKDMPDDASSRIAFYDTKINYVDKYIGNILHCISANYLTDNTYIVITADHGEEFCEHGDYHHMAKLYDELLRVPLIISGPNIRNSIISKQISMLDLSPSLCELLGINIPSCFLGHSFFSILDSKSDAPDSNIAKSHYFSENHFGLSLRSDEWKYISKYQHPSCALVEEELYHLVDDPKESINLADKKLSVVNAFRKLAEFHIIENGFKSILHQITQEESCSISEDSDIELKLRELGYFD